MTVLTAPQNLTAFMPNVMMPMRFVSSALIKHIVVALIDWPGLHYFVDPSGQSLLPLKI
jgi:hypothetical protein